MPTKIPRIIVIYIYMSDLVKYISVVVKRMKPVPLRLPPSVILLPHSKIFGLSKSFNFFLTKSIVRISSSANTIFIFLPHENVDGNLIPTLFKDRLPDYHMFLILKPVRIFGCLQFHDDPTS